MKTYKVRFTKKVYDQIESIASYIASINTVESSIQYVNSLIDEILTLSYYADIISKLQWKAQCVKYPDTKRLLVKKGKLTVFFVTYKDFVLILDIIPSSLVTEKSDSTP
ncbi:MAG: hypothetical protein Q4F69_05585 [Bacteroidia bacterium]|nr:hypothetical protein [Bacteroidales bacterium]MDO5341906.1 hypothetical protein [Bacteroidia bacterium]